MVLSSFIITSRETLEAALVIGIVLAYLTKSDNRRYVKTVYFGILVGIVLSGIAAVIFSLVAGGFEGRAEGIFEGFTMLIAAILLTTMILWMLRQRQIAKKIEGQVHHHITKAKFNNTFALGLFLLIVIAILREGAETVIFFSALNYSSGISVFGALLGVIVAIVVGYLFFISAVKINIKKLFTISSIILILFAAGLVAHGVHELQEVALIPYVIEEVWDINPAVAVEGSYPLLHERGIIGSFLKGLLGYNGNPSLLEVLFYIGYLGIIFFVYCSFDKSSIQKTFFKF